LLLFPSGTIARGDCRRSRTSEGTFHSVDGFGRLVDWFEQASRSLPGRPLHADFHQRCPHGHWLCAGPGGFFLELAECPPPPGIPGHAFSTGNTSSRPTSPCPRPTLTTARLRLWSMRTIRPILSKRGT